MIDEAFNNKKYLERILYKEHKLTFIWQNKLKKAYSRLKIILILSTRFRKKLLSQNLLRNNLIRATNFQHKINKNRYELVEFDKNKGKIYKLLPQSFEKEKNREEHNMKNLYNQHNNTPDINDPPVHNISNNLPKEKNVFINSYNSNFETTLINNQNSLLFTRNTHLYSNNIFNNNILVPKKESPLNFINEANLRETNKMITPIKLNYLNNNLIETSNNEYFQTRIFQNFHIENFQIFYESKKHNISNKKKYKIFYTKSRHYIFPTNKKVFSCQEISITNPPILDYLSMFIIKKIKTILIFLIYLYIWILLVVFIQSIYKQFGKNIIEICIMPLIYMLIIKLTIIFNIMMLLTTIILYKLGEYFIKTSKLTLISKIIFKGLVPPLAFHHFVALKTFLQLFKNNKI